PLRRWPTSFFFSSRRRHTRFSRDWSSDVCSSDLGNTSYDASEVVFDTTKNNKVFAVVNGYVSYIGRDVIELMTYDQQVTVRYREIGRASCREECRSRCWPAQSTIKDMGDK